MLDVAICYDFIMKSEIIQKGGIVIYKTSNNEVDLKVRMEDETIWLDARQMAELFDVKRPAIVKHVQNIYKNGELIEKATCSILEQVALDGRIRKTHLYNLDMIISVGYRVNSKQASQFRIWATSVLKKYLIEGYAINKKRLQETQERFVDLQNTITFLAEKTQRDNLHGQESEILNLLNTYSKSLTFLEQFDKDLLHTPKGKKARWKLDYEEAKKIIETVKKNLINQKEAIGLFGQERKDAFAGIIGNIYQTFDGQELYSSIESKAAHLLYFIIKDHPFSDGNKRSGSFLFIYFLDKNNFLYKKSGEKKINDNALTALALLVAESDPKEKDLMIKLIMNLLG